MVGWSGHEDVVGRGFVWIRFQLLRLGLTIDDEVGVFGVDVFAFVGRGRLLAGWWRDLFVFAVAGCNGLQGRCAFVMGQVVAAHNVWRPDQRFRVEADVSFCFPAFDALLEVRVIQPQCICFRYWVAHERT